MKRSSRKLIKNIINTESDINIITKKISPIMIELTAFIVYSNMDNNNFKPTFNNEIINDELINMLTLIPLLINTSGLIETASFWYVPL